MVSGPNFSQRKPSVVHRVKKWLELPELAGVSLDDPRLTQIRIGVIQQKQFLRKLYLEWYRLLKLTSEHVPDGVKVEIGSGAGFFKEVLPAVITSEILRIDNADIVFSAERMPFKDASLAALYMIDVLHHIPTPRNFFREAVRCLRPGGNIVMIEPYNTPWGRYVWRNFHHEPFEPDAGWELPGSGPLSDANGAVPWIILSRDRDEFRKSYPQLKILRIKPIMPLTYLLSGGVSMRSLLPGFLYYPWRTLEKLLGPLNRALGMFALIHLQRD